MALFNLKGRDYITTRDYTREELEYLIQMSIDLKKIWYSGIRVRPLEGKAVALLFKKPSTRTRNSFQAAVFRLGGFSVYMRPDELQLQRGEPVKDTARTLDRYYDALVIRTFGQEEIVDYANYMRNPVINALSDEEHPCQALADLMTIKE
ncbi:MAG: ornithine carbamoyltransferase, partial [Candidatus Korarchaeum sp.]|nr:ornithine carbamoyltransferase [Candidatus Korarchaeum sp.]